MIICNFVLRAISAHKDDDTWQYITFKDLFDLVSRAAKGFISVCTQINILSPIEVNIYFSNYPITPWNTIIDCLDPSPCNQCDSR